MAAILNSANLHSAILVFFLSNSLTLAKIGSHYLHKKTLTHWFRINVMMAAILNSAMLDSDTAILDSDTLLSSLRFTQKHSLSTLTLTQTNSIQLTRWWQPSWILPSWIQPCCTKLWPNLIQTDSNSFILTQPEDGSEIEFCHLWFIHLVQKNLHSIILSKLDDGSNLEFYQFAFSYLSFPSQSHSHFPRLVPTIYTKKTLTHWFWLNLMIAAILKSAILNSAILYKKYFTHSFWLNLMMAAILNSAMLDSDTAILVSDTLLSSLRFTQKTHSLHSDSDSN